MLRPLALLLALALAAPAAATDSPDPDRLRLADPVRVRTWYQHRPDPTGAFVAVVELVAGTLPVTDVRVEVTPTTEVTLAAGAEGWRGDLAAGERRFLRIIGTSTRPGHRLPVGVAVAADYEFPADAALEALGPDVADRASEVEARRGELVQRLRFFSTR
jgi:hypothetical protein